MMNTFQFMSWFGGAGAPEDNKGNKASVLPPNRKNLRYLRFLLLKE
jgi:hypothetical protein